MQNQAQPSSVRPVDAAEVCFLIPTKDRPQYVQMMLESIANMTVQPGQLIVVDGSNSAKSVCDSFPQLAVDYFQCSPPGQVRQRNLGVSKVRQNIKLVACFDDDLILDPNCLERMLEFYNSSEKEYGGVAFNVINRRGYRFSLFKYLFCMGGRRPGELMPSGYNTNICDVKENIDVDWIYGGATLWQYRIMKEIERPDWYGDYAFAEDVEYSILVNRKYPLAVCAEAKFTDLLGSSAYQMTSSFGRKQVMIRIQMARRLEELSVAKAYWACIGESLESLVRILVNRNPKYFYRFVGNIRGLLESLLGRSHLN